jgi:hypothetical protein
MLGTGQASAQIKDGRTQSLQYREGELHFALGPGSTGELEVRGRLDRILEQRRLPDTWLARKDQYATASTSGFFEHAFQYLALTQPANQLSSRRAAVHLRIMAPGFVIRTVGFLDAARTNPSA